MTFVDDFVKALAATDAEGKLLHRLVDVEDFLALLILTSPVAGRGVDEEGTALLGRFAVRAGLKLGAGEADVSSAVDAYFQKHPLNEDVLKAAAKVTQAHLAAGGKSSTLGAAFASFAGEQQQKKPLGGGERPAGTTPAGPLARFLVRK